MILDTFANATFPQIGVICHQKLHQRRQKISEWHFCRFWCIMFRLARVHRSPAHRNAIAVFALPRPFVIQVSKRVDVRVCFVRVRSRGVLVCDGMSQCVLQDIFTEQVSVRTPRVCRTCGDRARLQTVHSVRQPYIYLICAPSCSPSRRPLAHLSLSRTDPTITMGRSPSPARRRREKDREREKRARKRSRERSRDRDGGDASSSNARGADGPSGSGGGGGGGRRQQRSRDRDRSRDRPSRRSR